MKLIRPLTFIMIIFFLNACSEKPDVPESFAEQAKEFEINNPDVIIDTLNIDDNVQSNYFKSLKLDDYFTSNFVENKSFETSTLFYGNPLIDDKCPGRPRTLGALTDGMQIKNHQFTSSSNIDLKLLGWLGPKMERKEVLIMTDYIQTKNVACSDDKIRTYGIGVRMFIHVKKRKRKVNLELPKLAANVELNRAQATFELKTIGIVGDKIREALPKNSEFNVENYSNVVKAVDNIIRLIKDNGDGVTITPQFIPNS